MVDHFYRATVKIPMDSGLPNDTAINVWSFRNIDPDADRAVDGAAIATRLDTFYTLLANRYSSRCNLAAAEFSIVDLTDPQPRIPFLISDQHPSAEQSANFDLPPEVAICLSFRGAASSGANPRRRRGRVYLGPWQTSSSTDYHDVLAADITLILGSATTALADTNDELEWCVYSPYTHHNVPVGRNINEKDEDGNPVFPEGDAADLAQSFTVVTHYWCDNAFDTQRRRGVKATSRTTVAV